MLGAGAGGERRAVGSALCPARPGPCSPGWGASGWDGRDGELGRAGLLEARLEREGSSSSSLQKRFTAPDDSYPQSNKPRAQAASLCECGYAAIISAGI